MTDSFPRGFYFPPLSPTPPYPGGELTPPPPRLTLRAGGPLPPLTNKRNKSTSWRFSPRKTPPRSWRFYRL